MTGTGTRTVLSAACRVLPAVLSATCLVLVSTPALAQMPDPRAMHGQAIPAGELPVGSVTVRVVRQMVGNNIGGVTVELHGAGPVRTQVTGGDGRAQFAGLAPGSRVHAIAVVEGERLESTTFEVPRQGGVRSILVAGLGLGTAGAAPPAATGPSAATGAPPPASAAALAFGDNTRFAIEFQDDTITVFYLLDLVNPSSAPVSPQAALTFDLPVEATAATRLDGGSPLVTVAGHRVSIAGPIPPGVTSVPIAYRIERWNARHTIEQRFPLPIGQVAVGVQRLEGLSVQSPQAPSVRDASLSGQAFLIATGPTLSAGTPLQLALVGLPHRNRTPLYVALTLAALVAAAGVYLSVTRPVDSAATRRDTLEARRRKGLAALAGLEADRQRGGVGEAAYQTRRAKLMADLERVYSELDRTSQPPDGDEGLAA